MRKTYTRTKPHNIHSRTVNRAHAMYAEGKAIQDIAKSTGISRVTLWRMARDHSWQRGEFNPNYKFDAHSGPFTNELIDVTRKYAGKLQQTEMIPLIASVLVRMAEEVIQPSEGNPPAE